MICDPPAPEIISLRNWSPAARRRFTKHVADHIKVPLCYRQVFRMHRALLRPIIVLVLGLVLLAPVFELFDDGKDVEQGTDFVLMLLCIFVSIGLFTLCRRLVSLLFQLFIIAKVAEGVSGSLPNQPIQVAVSPPKSLAALGSLRI